MSSLTQPEPVSRRTFLNAVGVAGLGTLAGWGPIRLGSSSGHRIGGVVPGASSGWPEPTARVSADGILATRLRVREMRTRIGAAPTMAWTYESVYPGPTLEVRPGDRLSVELVNDSNEVTNLHTHGLHVSPNSPSDNVLLAIDPGRSYQYEYAVPPDHPAGTLWYHAHYHPLTDQQVFGGLFGTLIVRGELDELPGVAGRRERVLILSQIEIQDGAIVDGAKSSLSNQATLVNGQYQPILKIAPGEIQRWRILNAGSVFYRLQLDHHVLNTIAIDGNALAATQPTEVLEIPPGGRADVLVQAAAGGHYALRSLSWSDFGLYYTTAMTPHAQPVVRMQVAGPPAPSGPGLPTTLLPFKDLRNVPVDRRRVFQLSEREPRGTGQLNKFSYYINGRQYVHGANPVGATMLLGSTEEWEFVNLTYEPHPLHIHVNPFQVIAVNGALSNELHYRDTAKLPPFGTLTIRHQFLDFTGLFVWHCHILFHEDNGMMQLVQVVATPAEVQAADAAAHTTADSTGTTTQQLYCHLRA